ncbi:hypothetical protein [Psychrobacter sp. I-STPA6b]|uniref:FimV/HubP-related protein n=1 Tax=Psychrobacter sp. I-STPA6b TaxID=2585718 RepID=UPI001D0BF4CE|nr:hypothetical protein [Psychrobacter sp. I-STPA6b]
MSWQLPRHFNLAKLSAVISLLLTGNTLYAANIGSTQVNSNQYEPLSATIDISDIDPDNFSVSLADNSTYRELGLNSKSTMSARFVKTGANSGRVIITTSTPLADPFADVVLTVNDNGNQKVIPKTLLLPLDKTSKSVSAPQVAAQPKTTGNTAQPNLPMITPLPAKTTGTPLVVNKSAPPPLQTAPISTPKPSTVETTDSEIMVKDSATNTTDFASSASGTDVQSDILKIQINRTYRTPTGETIATQNTLTDSDDAPATQTASQQTEQESETVIATATTETETTNVEEGEQVTATTNTQSDDNNASTPSIAAGKSTYTVQRNDNLWTIASQIAKENNLDVPTVMKQIQAHNQDAFINNDVSLLKANATLTLPDYEVIPSKLGIRAATEARQSQQNQSARTSNRSNRHSSNRRSNRNARNSHTPTRTARTAQALPSKPQVTLVTPGNSGSATGSQTRNSANGSGLNNDLVNKLQTTRQQTANRAQQVRSLSGQLSESTRQIQLQNKRLAELEQRLKNLRNN